MDILLKVLGVISTLVTVVGALLTLYARFMDMKQREVKKQVEETQREARPQPVSPEGTVAEGENEPEDEYEPPIDSKQVEHARNLVRNPAITLIVVGFLGLADCLVGTCITVFIALLGTNEEINDLSAVEKFITVFLNLIFSVLYGITIWAGFNMLNLRNYWLSMAGSFAAMPGFACCCCLAGIPIGIWSVTVLLKPEVKSAFT